MVFKGPRLVTILDVLVGAVSRSDMKIAVRSCFDEAFDDLTANTNYKDQAWDIIEWANRREQLLELVECAQKRNPKRRDLLKLYEDLKRESDADSKALPAPARAESGSRHSKSKWEGKSGSIVVVQGRAWPDNRQAKELGIKWVEIKKGEFWMGSDLSADPDASIDELPLHSLELPTYWISKHPITNAQYGVFLEAVKYRYPLSWIEAGRQMPVGKENHPVVTIRWEDALEFCRWLRVRLPSEAEWEKAARGRNGNIWPWGSDPPTVEHCNCDIGRPAAAVDNYDDDMYAAAQEDSLFYVRNTTAVDQFPKGQSPYRVMDMAGNVWEWTSNLPWKYMYNPADGRENIEDVRQDRILRGGSYGNPSGGVRCARRKRERCDVELANIGFRIVVSA